MKLKDRKLKKWTKNIKDWEMKSYLLSETYIDYGILPPSTTMMEEPISAP